MHRSWVRVALLVAALPGCTPARHAADPATERPLVRVAILPPLWVTSQPTVRLDAAREAARELSTLRGVALADRQRAAELTNGEQSCQEDAVCVRRVGRKLQVDKAIVIRLAELGSTVIVRVSLVDARGSSREQTNQQVVRGASGERVGRAIGRMSAELVRPLLPSEPEVEQAWYEHWWVWVTAGTLVIGAVVTAVVIAVMNADEESPDVVVTPP